MRSDSQRKNLKYFFVDIFMMLVLFANLGMIIFDWMYQYLYLDEILNVQLPAFAAWYQINIHEQFFTIDLWFVMVFITEFVVRWIVAIVRKTYYKWFFYPFIHWYDLIGCIPVDALRFARLFRIFSIIYRLHKLQMINVKNTYVYKQLAYYYNIVVEEVSDRVVINVLGGLQEELENGGPVLEKVVNEVIQPRRDVIIQWLSHKIATAVAENYKGRSEEMRRYVSQLVNQSLKKNEQMSLLNNIPVVGKSIGQVVGSTASDVVFQVIDQLLADLGSDQNKALLEEAYDVAITAVTTPDEDEITATLLHETINDILEIIKDQVKVQRWKEQIADEMPVGKTE